MRTLKNHRNHSSAIRCKIWKLIHRYLRDQLRFLELKYRNRCVSWPRRGYVCFRKCQKCRKNLFVKLNFKFETEWHTIFSSTLLSGATFAARFALRKNAEKSTDCRFCRSEGAPWPSLYHINTWRTHHNSTVYLQLNYKDELLGKYLAVC